MSTPEGFSALVQRYFTQHLGQHKQASPRTLTAYRDTFRLLFAFLQQVHRGCVAEYVWLGYESIETTHGYVEADLELQQRALDKLTPASGKVSRFKADDSLLRFLAGL
jgi:hypothetical protein